MNQNRHKNTIALSRLDTSECADFNVGMFRIGVTAELITDDVDLVNEWRVAIEAQLKRFVDDRLKAKV